MILFIIISLKTYFADKIQASIFTAHLHCHFQNNDNLFTFNLIFIKLLYIGKIYFKF